MSQADLEARLEAFRRGDVRTASSNSSPPSPELRAAVLERMGQPDTPGFDLIFLTGEFQLGDVGAMIPELSRRVLDVALPRKARARFANALAQADVDRWIALTEDVSDDDLTLAAEGMLEMILTCQSFGLRDDDTLAKFLAMTVPDRMEELAPVVEPIRRAVQVPASQVYRDVFADERLRPFWPALAPALAEEGSPESLAALDLALLRAPDALESAPVREAREALLARSQALRAHAAPEGEFYLCAPDESGTTIGVIALRQGSARQILLFDFIRGSPLQLRTGGKMPAEAARSLITQSVLKGNSVEVPFLEGLAMLNKIAGDGEGGGDRALWLPLSAAMRDAPELEPLERGEPLAVDELSAQLESGPLSTWHLEQENLALLLEQLTCFAEESKGDAAILALTSLRIEQGARWLKWAGHDELSRRVAAHCIRAEDPASLPLFLRFAAYWAAAEAKRTLASR